jgi:hypothetical protein
MLKFSADRNYKLGMNDFMMRLGQLEMEDKDMTESVVKTLCDSHR